MQPLAYYGIFLSSGHLPDANVHQWTDFLLLFSVLSAYTVYILHLKLPHSPKRTNREIIVLIEKERVKDQQSSEGSDFILSAGPDCEWLSGLFAHGALQGRSLAETKPAKRRGKTANRLDVVTQKQLEQQTHIELETTRDESQGPKWRLIFFNEMVEKTGRI